MNVVAPDADLAVKTAADFDPRMLASHVRRGVVLPLIIFIAGFTLYAASATAAVLLTDTGWKIGLAVLAGVFIANLAIIGHDAVHNSFTRFRWLNRIVGTLAFLPALHPYSRWEYHHNKVHHRYVGQIGVDNAYPPMTVEQYKGAPFAHRTYYRFMRSLIGQPFFYMVDIWAPSMFFPGPRQWQTFERIDWVDLAVTWVWMVGWVAMLALASSQVTGGTFWAAVPNAALYGFVIPFLVWNVFIAFVTIVQHTGPRVRWHMPTGQPSTFEQKLRGTVHMGFPQIIDWTFHRVMQHVAHHVNPVVPLYHLKAAETDLVANSPQAPVVQVWTPLYHWRMTRDCKLYDPARDCWCDFAFQPTGVKRQPPAQAKAA